jgi:hypothetical protein
VVTVSIKRALVLLCAPVLALGFSACASTASSSSYKGEDHAIAQTIVNLQNQATAGEAQKICSELLASAVTARLDSASGGCKQALKDQLAQVDTPQLTIQSVELDDSSNATVRVKSTYAGNNKVTAITLVKESGAWKISKLG